ITLHSLPRHNDLYVECLHVCDDTGQRFLLELRERTQSYDTPVSEGLADHRDGWSDDVCFYGASSLHCLTCPPHFSCQAHARDDVVDEIYVPRAHWYVTGCPFFGSLCSVTVAFMSLA